MNCETAQEKLPELLTGALDRQTELETLTHLAGCEACRHELAFWAQVRQAALENEADADEDAIRGVRQELFGPGSLSVLESFRLAGRALGMAGSACKLALASMGI